MNVNHDKLKYFLKEDAFIVSNHARSRMFQRNISTENIKEVIIHGQIVEDYPEDEPCPVVVAECEDHKNNHSVYSGKQ